MSSADLFFKGRGFFHRSCPRAADLQNRSTLHLLFCRAERRSAKGQRAGPLHEHATLHEHPARDVHGQDGHATTLVAAAPLGEPPR